jgi:hypothetical protein
MTVYSEEMPMKTIDLSNNINEEKHKEKPKKFKNILKELMTPPPKEEKPNIHLSGGGVFKKLDKI